MSLAKSSLQIFSTRIFRLVVSFITSILIARWLQPEGRGAYSLITQFSLIAVAFGGMSIGHATIHYSGSERYSVKEQVSNALLSSFLLSLLTCMVVVLFRGWLCLIIPLNSTILLMLVIIIPISILDVNLRSILQSQYKFSWINTLEIIQAVAFAGVILALYAFAEPSLDKALYAWILSLVFSFIVLVRMLREVSPLNLKLNLNWRIFREHLSFGSKAHLSTIIGLLSLRFDQYILGYMTDKASVGRYAIAVSLAELIWLLPASVSFVLLPKIAHSNNVESSKSIIKACWYVTGFSAVAACFLAIVAVPLINYGYGTSYHDSLMVLWILLPGVVATSVTTITTPYFLGKLGKPHLGAIVASVSLCSNIVFNLILIPKYAINGAAISSTCSYIMAAALNLFLFNRVRAK
ncbi:flippase [Trichlorobacter lovleyi]|uniref:flippase n=1 Tax=Trichlorobacter lovleyi TaxID=313985 RepID=UPI0024812332|nr:flippase [Trichlorobacter lovleyi]